MDTTIESLFNEFIEGLSRILNAFFGFDLQSFLESLPPKLEIIPWDTLTPYDSFTSYIIGVVIDIFNALMSTYQVVITFLSNTYLHGFWMDLLFGRNSFSLLEFMFGFGLPIVILYWFLRWIIGLIIDIV